MRPEPGPSHTHPTPQAWIDGLYKAFNGSVDVPGSGEWEYYTRPLPTITVGNIVPEVDPGLGSTSISVVYVGMRGGKGGEGGAQQGKEFWPCTGGKGPARSWPSP